MLEFVDKQLGNYRTLRLLGEGGFAQVYLGEHLYLKTMAAIKVLRANLPENDLQTFLNEAQIVAHLRHPQIVRVLEFGVTPDYTPFLAMTYAPHGTLRRRHPKGTSLSQETIVTYVKQVAAALQFAHDHTLIHRDVKPENMLIGQNGEVLLSDFGIAVAAHHTDTQNKEEISGTVFYMAPEQLQGRPRPASDQYSLAVIVYEWLCGSLPFTGSGLLAIAHQHLEALPPSLKSRVPTLSLAVEAVVMRALAKDPAARFEDVQAFAQALETACRPDIASLSEAVTSSLSVVVPQSSIASKAQSSSNAISPSPPRFSRRAVAITLAGGLGLSLLGGSAWVVLTRSTSAPPQSSRKVSFSLQSRSPGATLATYTQHTKPIMGLSWSPDGKWITSASRDKTVHVWSPHNTGKGQAFIYSRHTAAILTVAWSPDGKYIASGGNDKTVHVWNAPHMSANPPGETRVVYPDPYGEVAALAWSPESKRVASISSHIMQVWDADSGKHTSYYTDVAQYGLSSKQGPQKAVAWSPDGLFLTSNMIFVSVWDVASGNRLITYTGLHASPVHGLAWSPDSKHVASASDDNTVQIWDAATGNMLILYKGHRDAVYAVSWSPDGRYLASASRDTTVQIWEAVSGKQRMTYRGHTAPVNSVVWYGDSRHVASGGDDNKVLVWQAV